MSSLKTSVLATATLTGTIIGVGLFSLPYITAKVGILVMLGYFALLGVLAIVIHLIYGELSLQTPDFKRLPGFAKLYLGGVGEKIALFSVIISLLGALLAYLIVGSEFLEGLLSPLFGGGNAAYALLYFAIGAVLIFFGMKIIAHVEFWGLALFFLILFIIFFQGKDFININNLISHFTVQGSGLKMLFLPYGPVLFSLWGLPLIPDIEEMVRGKKHLFKRIILVSVVISIVVYLFFVFMVLGITGSNTTDSALSGLGGLGNNIALFGFIFGLLTTFTSFITVGLTLKKVLHYDLKIAEKLSWAVVCFVPLILFFLGINKFISVISFIGGVMLGIDGILILLMYNKVKGKKFRMLIYPLGLIFVLGIAYEIIYALR